MTRINKTQYKISGHTPQGREFKITQIIKKEKKKERKETQEKKKHRVQSS